MKKKQLREEIEEIIRGLLIRGYEMGKQQHITPLTYTLDTDSGKKEYDQLLQLFKEETLRLIGEDEKQKLIDRGDNRKEVYFKYSIQIRNQLREELRQKMRKL